MRYDWLVPASEASGIKAVMDPRVCIEPISNKHDLVTSTSTSFSTYLTPLIVVWKPTPKAMIKKTIAAPNAGTPIILAIATKQLSSGKRIVFLFTSFSWSSILLLSDIVVE